MMNTVVTPTEVRAVAQIKPSRGWFFYVQRGMKWLVIILVSIVVLGCGFQVAATELDKRGYLPPGQMVDVDGHLMHLYCTGEGSPTVILEAGAYSFSLEWYWVQQQLSTSYRVCSYDRAGNGWSEPVSGLRDGLTIVHELHSLLAEAAIPGPYVLVGHSLGGVTNPIYASEYSGEVLGIVLVDSAIPISTLWPDQSYFERYKSDNAIAYSLMTVLMRVGALRFIISNEFRSYGYPADVTTQLTAFKSTAQSVDTWDAEVRLAQWDLGQEATNASDLGSLPLAVLWAGHPEYTAPEDREKLEEIWSKVAVHSSNSVARIIDGANHGSIIGDEQYASQVSVAVQDVIQSGEGGQVLK